MYINKYCNVLWTIYCDDLNDSQSCGKTVYWIQIFKFFFFKQFKTITNCSQTKQTKQTKATKIGETKNSKWIHCFILCAQMPKMRNSLFYGAIVFLSIPRQVYSMVMQFGEIRIKCCASWIKERWKYSENFQLLDNNITIGWDF